MGDVSLHPAVTDRLRHDRCAVSWLARMAEAYAGIGDERTAARFRESARLKAEAAARYVARIAPIAIPDRPR